MSSQKSKHVTDLVALILVIVGGINWLLVGLGGWDWNIVAAIFGSGDVGRALQSITYIIVGIAALYVTVRSPAMSHFKTEPHERGMAEPTQPRPTV